MEILVNITATSIEDLGRQFREAAKAFEQALDLMQPAAPTPPPPPAAETAAAPAKRSPGRRRARAEVEEDEPPLDAAFATEDEAAVNGATDLLVTQDEAVSAVKAFIKNHKDGRARGEALIHGMLATLGFEKVTKMPEARLPELMQLMGETA